MSQGERGLPGDVVSTRNRPDVYGRILLRYNIRAHIFISDLVFEYSKNIYSIDEPMVTY